VFAPASDRLRIVANGMELFNAPVKYFVRLPVEIHFAENPIGGTACDPVLHGRILLPDGRELRGHPTPLFTLRQRVVGWIAISRWQAVSAFLMGLAVFVFWERLRWRNVMQALLLIPHGSRAFAGHRYGGELFRHLWLHRWFLGTATFATFAFAWIVSCGTFDLIYPESFGNFYEHQAASLLQGRLDVPDEAISGEAFIVDGKRYGYFGITPALLRLPFVIFGFHFGELSRAFMLLYFAVTLAVCYALLRAVYQLSGRGDGPPSRWATVCFIGGAGLGSTLYYLGSRAYVYHEAILCGVMFALISCWYALRHFAAPASRAWIVALVCGILSVHARPPTGFFALTFLGAMALAVVIRSGAQRSTIIRRQLVIGALCGFGVFTFNILSYLKFKTFEGCPLRYNVQYDAKRLARIDGKQFHLANLGISLDSYLVRPNFHFESSFPYFFLGSIAPGRPWAQSKIDYHDKTLGFPYAMPGLFALATLGGVAAFAALPRMRILVIATWAAGIPMSLAMFTAIAITHRYTADFCPFLFVAAALGIVGVESFSGFWRSLTRMVIGVATLCSVLITFAISLHHQGHDVWGVPDGVREKYTALRRGVDDVVQAFRR
jgi:hypothetical protein